MLAHGPIPFSAGQVTCCFFSGLRRSEGMASCFPGYSCSHCITSTSCLVFPPILPAWPISVLLKYDWQNTDNSPASSINSRTFCLGPGRTGLAQHYTWSGWVPQYSLSTRLNLLGSLLNTSGVQWPSLKRPEAQYFSALSEIWEQHLPYSAVIMPHVLSGYYSKARLTSM